jgi:HSP20 family protein
MTIMRFDPFRELVSMRETFNRFFEQTLAWPGTEFPTMFSEVPVLDIYETDELIKVEMPLPGLKAKEIDVTLSGNLLTIKGEQKAKEEVKEEQYYRREVRHSAFERRGSCRTPLTSSIRQLTSRPAC